MRVTKGDTRSSRATGKHPTRDPKGAIAWRSSAVGPCWQDLSLPNCDADHLAQHVLIVLTPLI